MSDALGVSSDYVEPGRGILRSRLLPPRLPPACLPRPELAAQIVERLDGRLVVVVAGAGYGKTTLLTQALPQLSRPWVWCSCDDRLTDPRQLLAHLAAGLTDRFPGFGARLTLEGSPEEQVAELANEILETIADDFVVVLDDVHTLGAAAGVLSLLVEDLPPNVHLALAGRMPLPFPLARLRAAQVLELSEHELALSEAEAGRLLALVGKTVDAEEISRLHRRTEGWIAGLIMAARSGATQTAPGEGVAHFEYLAEEVLGRQPPEIQRFLLDTAMLERFTPEVAEVVTGRADAAEFARRLVADHLFTVRLETGSDGETYRYHHLFQAFLRQRRETGEPEALRGVHDRAAMAWMAAGQLADAVPHFLAAGNPQAAVEALEPVAESMLNTPQAESLAGWLDQIPQELWAERPQLVLAHASLLLTRGEHEASFDAFERAIDQLLAAGEQERAAAAFLRLLQSMITAGTRPARRIEAGLRYSGRIDPGARMLAHARILLASSYAYACRFDDAEAELRAALELPSARDSPVLAIYADIVRTYYIRYQTGRPEEALLDLQEAVAALELRESDDELAFMPYARMFAVYLLNDLGRYEEALAETTRTEDAAARRGMRRTQQRVVAWIRSVALAGLGRWEELAAELAPPTRAGPHVEATSYSYRYRANASQLAAHQGDRAAVCAHAAAARNEMSAFGDAFDKPMVLCDLARAALAVGEVDLARDLAADARAIGRAIGTPQAEARGALLEAAALGVGEAGDAALAEALELTESWSLTMLWTRRERRTAGELLARAILGPLGPPGLAARLAAACGGEVFRECAARLKTAPAKRRAELAEAAGDAVNVDAGSLEGLLRDRDAGVRAAARRSRARLDARPRPSLRIVSLGRLAVERDGIPVPEDAFNRQKTRALLGVLLATRGSVHREALMEWLWPDLPPERAAGSLRVALHELRRGLAPELEANAPGNPVLAEGETIRLALGEGDEWDAAAILEVVSADAAESAEVEIERLRVVEARYAGPFLPEWPYEDWAAAMRVELEDGYREVLVRLADALMMSGRVSEAIRWYRKLLTLDPEREGSHRALMRCYAATGERAQALRQYHACRTVLQREQGIPPSPETRALYAELLGDGEPADEDAASA